jgi:hypothetical protein
MRKRVYPQLKAKTRIRPLGGIGRRSGFKIHFTPHRKFQAKLKATMIACASDASAPSVPITGELAIVVRAWRSLGAELRRAIVRMVGG